VPTQLHSSPQSPEEPKQQKKQKKKQEVKSDLEKEFTNPWGNQRRKADQWQHKELGVL